MYVVLLRLIIVILGIWLFFKYLFCIVIEMLADDPNNTDEINEELNETRKIEQFKLTAVGFIFLSLVFVDQALLPFLNRCLNNDPCDRGSFSCA